MLRRPASMNSKMHDLAFRRWWQMAIPPPRPAAAATRTKAPGSARTSRGRRLSALHGAVPWDISGGVGAQWQHLLKNTGAVQSCCGPVWCAIVEDQWFTMFTVAGEDPKLLARLASVTLCAFSAARRAIGVRSRCSIFAARLPVVIIQPQPLLDQHVAMHPVALHCAESSEPRPSLAHRRQREDRPVAAVDDFLRAVHRAEAACSRRRSGSGRLRAEVSP